MKLGRLIYWIAIIVNVIISYFMLKHGWNIFGGFMAFMAFVGIINYIHIEQLNREAESPKYKSRRAAYFNSLSHEQQEAYLDNIEKELQKLNK